MCLFICSHLLRPLQVEASLMMAEQDTDQWVQQNVVRNHDIVTFLQQNNGVWFSMGSWPIQLQVLGHLSSFNYGFYLTEWALVPDCDWLHLQLFVFFSARVAPAYHQCTHHYRSQGFIASLVFTFLIWSCAEYLPVSMAVRVLTRHQLCLSMFTELCIHCFQQQGLTTSLWMINQQYAWEQPGQSESFFDVLLTNK